MIVRALSLLFDAVVVFLILRAIVRMLTGGRAAPRRPPAPTVDERAGGTLVRDPHCGTYVVPARAIAVRRGSETLYFCSAACRDAFQPQA